jgi:F420-0:gamma-glutamyl ligase-like protein
MTPDVRRLRNLKRATIDAGNLHRRVIAQSFGSNKVIKGATRDPGGSDLGQLPYCYMKPFAKLAVKPTNWWLRSNLNGAAERIRASH